MRSLTPIPALTLDDFETQPFRVGGSAELAAHPEVVFAELGDPSLWFPLMKRSVWKTGATSGVGAEREIEHRVFGRARERMLAWDTGKRVAFTMTGVTSPLVSRMGEEWLVTSAGPGRTRLEWRVVATPSRLGRVLTPAIKLSLHRMFARALTNIGKRAAAYKPGKHAS